MADLVIIYSDKEIDTTNFIKLAGEDYYTLSDVGELQFHFNSAVRDIDSYFYFCLDISTGVLPSVNIPECCNSKVLLFTDARDLSAQLSGQTPKRTLQAWQKEESQMKCSTSSGSPAISSNTAGVVTTPFELPSVTKMSESVVPNDMLDTIMNVPDSPVIDNYAFANTDSLKLQLHGKDEQIKQYQLCLSQQTDKLAERDSVHRKQLLTLQEQYTTSIKEANKRLRDADNCLKAYKDKNIYLYSLYMDKPRGVLQATLNIPTVAGITPIVASTMGAYLDILDGVKSACDAGESFVLFDFSRDLSLVNLLRLKHKSRGVLDLQDGKITSIRYKNADIVAPMLYHDMIMMTWNWADIVKKAEQYAKGRSVIFLFKDLSLFSVKYVIANLMQALPMHICIECNPLILTSVINELKFLPTSDNILLQVLNYYVKAKSLLKLCIGDAYKVNLLSSKIEFSDLIKSKEDW